MELIKQFLAIIFLVFMGSLLLIYAPPVLSLAIVIGGGWVVGKTSRPVYGVVAAIVIVLACLLIQKFGVAINHDLGLKQSHIVGMLVVAAIVALPLMFVLSMVSKESENPLHRVGYSCWAHKPNRSVNCDALPATRLRAPYLQR